MINRNKQSLTYYEKYICLLCFITNISQMTFFVNSGLTRYVSIPLWFLLVIIYLKKNKGNLHIQSSKVLLLLFTYFITYFLFFSIIHPTLKYSQLIYPVCICLFIYCAGNFWGKNVSKYGFKCICTTYIISAMLVCINVYTIYIKGNSIMGRTYVYSSKNSVSQILLTAWILILILKLNEGKLLKKIFYICCFFISFYCIIFLKSRSTIIGIPIVVILIIINKNINKKVMKRTLFLILLIFVIFLINRNTLNILVNEVMYAGRDARDISDISSGRSDEWENFFNDWKGNEIFGKGSAKRESIILTTFLEYGILGGVPLLIIAIYPIRWGIHRMRLYKSTNLLIFTSIAFVYTINGFFEQLAPFGPGVKCYFLWFIFGLFKSNKLLYINNSVCIDTEDR